MISSFNKNTWRWPMRIAALAAAYYVTARLSLLLAIPPGFAAGIWLPAGIAWGILIATGRTKVVEQLVAQRTMELRRANAKNGEMLQSLKWRTEELMRSNVELEQFAYIASHDLQEPLRMVSAYCTLLKKRYSGKLDAKADQFLHFAADGADRMRRLIDDLLEFSRVGRTDPPHAPVDLNAAFRQAMSNLQAAIDESGATIEVGELPHVRGDEGRLTQVLQNLLANAIKFRGKSTPQVRVKADVAGPQVLVSVVDNGMGIEEEYFKRVFVVFQRLHTQEEFAGSGMGLAICKKIIEYHGGRIWLESKPGRGTTIHFTLSLAEAAAGPTAQCEAPLELAAELESSLAASV